MEPGENHANKRSRMGGSSANAAPKIGRGGQQPDDDDDDAELKGAVGAVGARGGAGLRPWHHPASRIYRVSRASGGKDRHSKVYTAKGLRDRRVRLSVSTAIQFYDLQDRLGLDQPSKAIEWLINSAAAAIAQLPTLEGSFPEPPKLEEKIQMEHGVDPDDDIQQQNQHLSLTKSGCSSTSETSKGSVLSLSRSECRIKARERARERAAKDKGKDQDDGHPGTAHQSISPTLNSQSSFTELLIGGGSSSGTVVTTAQMNSNANCNQKQIRYMPVAASSDYFSQAGLFCQARKAHHQPSSGFASPHLGNSSSVGMVPFNIAAAAAAAAAVGDHLEMQQFSLLQEPIAAVGPGDYNLNFSISSGLAGFNRGTLQSNSPSQLPQHHFQRLSPPVDGSNLPFFFGAAAPAAAATSAENQFLAGFDGRLHLCYGDGYRHSDLKGKGKN